MYVESTLDQAVGASGYGKLSALVSQHEMTLRPLDPLAADRGATTINRGPIQWFVRRQTGTSNHNRIRQRSDAAL